MVGAVTGTGETVNIDEKDLEVLRATQDGLTLVAAPYAAVGEEIGMGEAEVIERLRRMLDAGVVRRMGASLAHRKAGFTANAMTAWLVPEKRLDEVAETLARHREVTHCYSRKTAPGWPYNLYTMVHGRSRDECNRLIGEMSEEVNIDDYVILYSTRELKKTSFRV